MANIAKTLVPALVGLSLLAPLPAQAQSFTPEQKTEIEGVVREYLLQNPQILEDMFRALEEVRHEQEQERMSEALEQYLPVINNTQIAQILGNPEGKVTLIEFFDYNCGVCRSEHLVVQALIEANPDLKVLMWEWPVVRPPQSIDAARISLAVRKVAGREKWVEFHNALMESNTLADRDSSHGIAETLGLDRAAIEASLDGDIVVEHLQASGEVGDALAFRGTPTFIVGKSVIAGGGQIEELQALIDAERARLN